MQVTREKGASTGGNRPTGGSPDPFEPQAKARRHKLIAAINAGHSKEAEEADAALSEHLDVLYPENAAPR